MTSLLLTLLLNILYTTAVSRPYTKVLVLSDLHVPHHDVKALTVVKDFQKDFKPDITVALGDWIDGSSVSSFHHDIDPALDQLHEFEQCAQFLDDFKIKIFCEGNHEERFRRPSVPQDYRRLLDPKRWLNIAKRKIKWFKYSSAAKHIYRLGKLSFIHGLGS